MQITNNTSLTFGSIQVNKAKMTKSQRRIAESIFDSIKYDSRYAKYLENDLDIYLLPKSKEMVELRILDPYSGYFIRDDKGKIVNGQIRGTYNKHFETVLDSVLDTYNKVMEGILPRPKGDLSKIMANKTEMAEIHPERQKKLREVINDYKKMGCSSEEAFEMSKDFLIIEDADFVR